MVATINRLGLVLPQLPARPRQTVLALAPSAAMPRGYALHDEGGGSLQLVRTSDGARLGVMVSAEFACDYAATLARIEEQRRRMEEVA